MSIQELLATRSELDRRRDAHRREEIRLAAQGRALAMSLLAEIFHPSRGVQALRFGYDPAGGVKINPPAVKWRDPKPEEAVFVETVALIRLFIAELSRCGPDTCHKFALAGIHARNCMAYAEKIDPKEFQAWRSERESEALRAATPPCRDGCEPARL